MSKLISRQQGMTVISWVLVLGLIAFFATLVLRLGPIYLENFQVKSILSGLDDMPNLSLKSKSELHKIFNKKLYINAIKTVQAGKGGNFKITKQDKKLVIDVEYEVRQKIFYNIDALITFKEHYETVLH